MTFGKEPEGPELMPTKPTKSLSPLDVLRIYYSQGVIPSVTWAANLTVELSAVQDIRKCKTHRQVTIDQLSPEDQDTLRLFLIDIRNLDIVQSSHKAAVDEKTKQAMTAFLAGQQFELGGVEFRYQNKQLPGPVLVATIQPTPQAVTPEVQPSDTISILQQKAAALNAQAPCPPPEIN